MVERATADISYGLAPGILELARIAQADLVTHLKADLWAAWPGQLDASPTRIAGYFEDGLALLYHLAENGELPVSEVETCRRLAEQNPHYRFVYRLPMSAGFGIAIGRTLEGVLARTETEFIVETTALLNIFMTALDGVLDEQPKAIEPYWDKLVQAVQGKQLENPGVACDPVVSLCFRIVELWRSRITRAAADVPKALLDRFDNAVCESMSAEYKASKSYFLGGLPGSDKHLFGRTRWPHWTQAIVCLFSDGIPAGLELQAYQEMVFRIGDYAAILDDICDYVDDCVAGRWNTVLYAIAREQSYSVNNPAALQQRFLVALANDAMVDGMVAMALKARADLELSINGTGLPQDKLLRLIADLSYAYAGCGR